MALPGKRNLRKAIEAHGGVVADLAGHFGVTRQTVYNWLDHYQMRGLLSAARSNMREVAKDVLYEKLMHGDVGVAMFVMRHVGSDGEMLVIAPDVAEMLARMGLNTSDVVMQFEAMVRAQAAQVDRS